MQGSWAFLLFCFSVPVSSCFCLCVSCWTNLFHASHYHSVRESLLREQAVRLHASCASTLTEHVSTAALANHNEIAGFHLPAARLWSQVAADYRAQVAFDAACQANQRAWECSKHAAADDQDAAEEVELDARPPLGPWA